jgi:two-component system phosphate regulon sensor histidine kinase PhoR
MPESRVVRVLVAEDESDYLKLMVGHLLKRGFIVTGAEDGQEALEIFREDGPFDVLVADLAMPKMDGLELMRQARQIDPWLESIMITASGDIHNAINAMRRDGAHDYLLKPLDTMGSLSLAVQRAAQHRWLRMDRQDLLQQVAEQAKQLNRLIADVKDGILAVDSEGSILVANPAVIELFGRADLFQADAIAVLPGKILETVERWEKIGDRSPATVEIAWPEGRYHNISLTSLDGQKGGWVMVLHDITHLKEIEELKLQVLTEAVDRIRLPLARSVSALSELNGAASDDNVRATAVYKLANLLGGLQSWSEDLLSVIRLQSGLGLHTQKFDLGQAIRLQIGPQLEQAVSIRGGNLSVNVDEDLPMVEADPDLMTKLVHGLVQYIGRHDPSPEKVYLDVRCDMGQIWIEVGGDQDRTELIEGQDLDVHTGRNAEQSDLELAMSRAIVQRLGGKVWVRGSGSAARKIAVNFPVV